MFRASPARNMSRIKNQTRKNLSRGYLNWNPENGNLNRSLEALLGPLNIPKTLTLHWSSESPVNMHACIRFGV